MAQGDNDEASHHLSELASSHPCRAENWLNWAASLKGLKFTVAPTQILKRGLQFNPNDRNLWLALEQALFEMCNFKSSEKICKLKNLDSDLSNSEQLFNRQFLSLSYTQSEALCQQRREWSAALGGSPEAGESWPTLAGHAARGD